MLANLFNFKLILLLCTYVVFVRDSDAGVINVFGDVDYVQAGNGKGQEIVVG